jgi:ABC-2 type transport system ATP-binding protein
VAIARTLLHDPEVLILDEPANGLDPMARIEMRELMLSLAEQGKTLLVTSHVLPELARVCHRVVIITRGRLRAFGTLEEITRHLNQSRPMEVLLLHTEQVERAAEIIRRHLEASAEVHSSPAEATIRFRTAKREEELTGLLSALVAADVGVTQFREVQTDLEEAFMTVARSDQDGDAILAEVASEAEQTPSQQAIQRGRKGQ